MTGERPGSRGATALRAVAIAVLAFGLVFAFFAPNFFLWDQLRDPLAYPYPETYRARVALHQLHDPSLQPDDPGNRVIRWRLLFPWLGHLLRLPDRAYLAIPHLGCLAALAYVAGLTFRESGSRVAAFLATAAMATASWFFVSTGWLAYFDSWSILGILVLGFSPRRWAIGLACLLTPWVDERFVLTLPLGLVVRSLYFEGIRPRRDLLGDGLLAMALVVPYGLVRLVGLASARDTQSAEYLRVLHEGGWPPVGQVLDGLWSSLRGLWAFVAVPFLVCVSRGQARRAVFLGAMALATVLAYVRVAYDLSRSFSNLVPLALLGMILLLRGPGLRARGMLAVVLAFNLLAPARHVVVGWPATPPIRSLPAELALFRDRAAGAVRLSLGQGKALAGEGKFREALPHFDAAIRADPASYDAHVLRGLCLGRLGRFSKAIGSYDAAIRLRPDEPSTYYYRGKMRRREGDLPGAIRDLRQADALSAPDDPNRERIREVISTLQSETGSRQPPEH